jgi:hypothetical protein
VELHCISGNSGELYPKYDLNTIQNLLGPATYSIKENNIYTYTSEGKAVPLQAWSGPEGSRRLRFPNFMTTAQDGGRVVSLMDRPPLPPGNTSGTYFC